MAQRDIIVIGASAGGVEALTLLVKNLPEKINASIFIVLHIPPYSRSFLPQILGKVTSIPVSHPKDGEKIEQRHIYVAPPDHHILIEEDRVVVKKGPKENRFRPSIDALFRSAAYIYENRVIGVVLTGALDDGASGLWTIKRFGGKALVQQPDEAAFPEMPLNVLQYVDVDYILPVANIGMMMETLTNEKASPVPYISKEEKELLKMEVTISTRDNAFELGIMNKGEFTPLTCPECHGALVRLKEGKLTRFRCHTGHAFTASALLAGITQSSEETLWQAMRAMEEGTILIQHIAKEFEESGENKAAKIFQQKAKDLAQKARIIHDSVFSSEQLSEDKIYENEDIVKDKGYHPE
ncbi:MAG TPA: chemotaxis protein CheB [Hanamia sp.]|jgi:two-component system, chemotaxis family, protein-glutamate methylesterase/glutaminase|nr:chemotaxis protein CheB [Hanamia sp.]